MDFATIGWRDGVLVAVGLSGVYLVLAVLRLFQVGKRPRKPDASRDGPFAVALEPSFSAAESMMIDLSGEIPPGLVVPAPRAAASSAPAAAPAADFGRELARSSVEVEVQQLRRESTMLREEVAKLREELAGMKAASNVSPLYGEAMALAQRGVPAAGISGQCGISLAEAELVAALAHGQPIDKPFDTDEERNGGHSDSRTGTHG